MLGKQTPACVCVHTLKDLSVEDIGWRRGGPKRVGALVFCVSRKASVVCPVVGGVVVVVAIDALTSRHIEWGW